MKLKRPANKRATALGFLDYLGISAQWRLGYAPFDPCNLVLGSRVPIRIRYSRGDHGPLDKNPLQGFCLEKTV